MNNIRESIMIQNLGPLQNVLINDIKSLTVIIGKSTAGKSLIMKTIAMMRHIYKLQNII